jgi:hypothetical protein
MDSTTGIASSSRQNMQSIFLDDDIIDEYDAREQQLHQNQPMQQQLQQENPQQRPREDSMVSFNIESVVNVVHDSNITSHYIFMFIMCYLP